MVLTSLAGAAYLTAKLQAYTRLSQDDRLAIDQLSRTQRREAQPRRDLIREGQNPDHVRLVISGWACRYKDLPDGRRQIVGFFLPGDVCDLNVYILKQMDHSISAITRVIYTLIEPEEIERLTDERPRIARALWWHELVAASSQREWLLNIGQRSAYERLAHLLCELFIRLRSVGLTIGDSCDFPITQTDLAEACGLTSVHVNRTLQELRADGLITLTNRRLTIPDLDKLMQAGLFNPNYLHLDREGRHLDAND
jgi:CRP-like cAMP-binding protein